MALTRKLLKGMSLTDEQMDTIIEAHAETVDGLKNKISELEDQAKEIPTLQKKLEQAQAAIGDGDEEMVPKAEYDKLKKNFDDFKGEITAKEAKATKEKAARAYYESKNIIGKSLEIAMRGSRDEIAALEMDGEKIKDPAALDALIAGDFAGLVGTTSTRGANTETPPSTYSGADSGEKKPSRAAVLAARYHENLYGKAKEG